MGSSTSSADTTQIKNDINTLKSSISGLTTKVNNFQAASVDYPQLSSGLVNTPDNLNKIISGLTNTPDKLAGAIVPSMALNKTIMDSITNAIVANKDFPASVASSLTSDPTKKAILKGDKGEPGSMGDYTALKSNLFISTLSGAKHPATLWCADGDFCQVPTGNMGVEIPKLKIGNWYIYESGEGQLVFEKPGGDMNQENTGHVRFAPDGNIWVNRSIGRGWVGDNINDVRNNVNDLKNNVIRKDQKYFIRSNRGGMLQDAGGWSMNKGEWETMHFEQR
jgi:hypothetical protein